MSKRLARSNDFRRRTETTQKRRRQRQFLRCPRGVSAAGLLLGNGTVKGNSKSKGRTGHERRSHARTHRAHRVSFTKVGTSSQIRRPAFAGGCKMENRTSFTTSEDRTQAIARTGRSGRGGATPLEGRSPLTGHHAQRGRCSGSDVSPCHPPSLRKSAVASPLVTAVEQQARTQRLSVVLPNTGKQT